MQQQHSADGFARGLQDERAVPVERPDVRIAETAGIEPVVRRPVGRVEVPCNVSPDLVQKQPLARAVLRECLDAP